MPLGKDIGRGLSRFAKGYMIGQEAKWKEERATQNIFYKEQARQKAKRMLFPKVIPEGYRVGYGKEGERILEKGKEPSWAQKQKVASIRSGLKRGKVTIGREWGDPKEYPITSLKSAYAAISDAGLDPKLFSKELQRFQSITVRDTRTGQEGTIPQYQLEEALRSGYEQVQ